MSATRVNIDAIPKLSHDPSSYAPWRAAVEVALQLGDCWNAALGLDPEPGRVAATERRTRAGSVMPTGSEAGAFSSEDKKDWERWQARESRAQAMLKGTVSEAVRLDIEDLLAAADMWLYCDKMHEADLLENQRIVHARLWTLDLRGDASADEMSAHVETFSKAISDGKRVGIVLSDTERAQRFLATILDPAFNIVRAELAPIAKDKQSWAVVLSKYTTEIARRRARPPQGRQGNGGGKPLAMAVERRPRFERDKANDECRHCGKKGHWERDCRKKAAELQRGGLQGRGGRSARQRGGRGERKGVQDRQDVVAAADKRITIPPKADSGLLAAALEVDMDPWAGLTVAATEWAELDDDSDDRIVFPDQLDNPWFEDGSAEASNDALFTADTLQVESEAVEPVWVLDSGATDHLTPHRSILKRVRRLETPRVFGLASDTGTMQAIEVGEIDLVLSSGQRLTLRDVYHVPTARISLCSLSRLLRWGWRADLKGDGGTLERRQERLALRKKGSLWTVRLGRTHPTILLATAVDARSPLEAEHQRLGHIGIERLKELGRKDLLTEPWRVYKDDPFVTAACEVCARTKITRPPKAGDAPLLRGGGDGVGVDVDITGPFETSVDGCENMLVAIERSSKILGVVPIGRKSEAFNALQQFVAKIERQLGDRVRVIRSDGGGEFDSLEARAFYQSAGIQHYMTPRYTPELNGAAERTIRTVKDMIAAMLADSRLPHSYWSFAARYAAVIIMKLSVSARTGLSAWSALTGRERGLDSVLRFGQRCHAQIPSQIRRKASFTIERGEACRILGQSETQSGWIVQLDATGEIAHRRDVKVLEMSEDDEADVGHVTQSDQAQLIPVGSMGGKIASHSSQDDDRDDLEVPGDQPEPGQAQKSVAGVEISEEELTINDPAVAVSNTPEQPRVPRPSRLPVATNRSRIPVADRWTYVPVVETPPAPPVAANTVGRPVREKKAPAKFGAIVERLHSPFAFLSANAADGPVMPVDPRNLAEAMASDDRGEWIAAMEKEIANIESKGTWQEVKLPADRKAVGSRWVFKVKTDADGHVVKHKARLVAQGFSQVPGVDFEETFAPVGRLGSLRLLLAIAAADRMIVAQADVEGAYLNSPIDTEVYIRYPDGMRRRPGCDALLLLKSLYGLKQSARNWWEELGRVLHRQGFLRTNGDWGLYVRQDRQGRIVLVLVYVDDIVIAASSQGEIDDLWTALKAEWTITVIGDVGTVLGMKVSQDKARRTIWLSQPAYIDRVLERFPEHARRRTRSTPLPQDAKIDAEDVSTALTPYQELVGCLLWLAGCTRPDVMFAASYLSRALAAPTRQHWDLAQGVLTYLAHTRTVGLKLGGGKDDGLQGWVDSDWAGCKETRRSTTGWLMEFKGSPITWSSRRQATVSTSTVEAEYIAVAEAAKEAVWLRNLLCELGLEQRSPTPLSCDNQGSIRLAGQPTTHSRTKHIDIKHHLIRELVDTGKVNLRYVSSADQKADILTKSLPAAAHARHFEALGLGRPPAGAERALVHLAAAFSDLEGFGGSGKMLNDKVSRAPNRLPHHVVKPKRRNAASQTHQLAHQQRFAACARGVRDFMHAGGARGSQRGSGLPADTKIIDFGSVLMENGRTPSHQPEGSVGLDRATLATRGLGPLSSWSEDQQAWGCPVGPWHNRQTCCGHLQPADFEGEC